MGAIVFDSLLIDLCRVVEDPLLARFDSSKPANVFATGEFGIINDKLDVAGLGTLSKVLRRERLCVWRSDEMEVGTAS